MRARARLAALALGAAALLRPAVAPAQVMDDKIYSLILFDVLEYRTAGAEKPLSWDMAGWVGGDYTRLWIKTEGQQATAGAGGAFEVQALYSRLIAPFWEWQVGARVDVRHGPGADRARVLAVVGLEGLAPYWFELEPALFVSTEGDVSARLTASYDMFVTQRWILQPRLDAEAAVQDVPEFGVGSGLNRTELGLRLRYEWRRETAPYVGVAWVRRFGRTADFARAEGAAASEVAWVGGLRVWF